MADDATAEIRKRLDDPSKWVVRRGVPLFVPHTRTKPGPDGKPVEKYTVTADDLPVIAANTAALESEHGVVGRITPGHLNFDPKAKESDQPPLYGFQRNPRVGTYGPKNKPAVLVDNYYFPEHAAAADRLPYRSAEYYHGPKEIRGQALLIRDAALPLGAVAYGAGGSPDTYAGDAPECYSMPVMGADQKFTPEEEKLFSRMVEYLQANGLCKGPGEDDDPADPDGKKKGVSADADDPKKKPKPEPYMADTVTPEMYAGLKAEHEAAKASHKADLDKLRADIEAEKQRNACEKLVLGLKAEGYQLDADTVTAEVAELMPRDEKGRTKRVGELRLIHAKAKAPNTTPIDVYAGNVTPESDHPLKPDQYHAEAMELMLDNPGMQFPEAVKAIKKAKAGAK